MVAVHSAAGQRADTTWRPARRSGPGITIITSTAAVPAAGSGRGIEVNPDARKCRAGPHVPGPGTACAAAGPDLTPAAARELTPVPVAA
jgi:hypothetical protein